MSVHFPAILIEPHERGEPNIMFISLYMIYDGTVPQPLQAKLIFFCRDGNLGLIIGCYSNVRHTSWESSNRNRRGYDLGDFFASYQTGRCNVDNKPTFHVAYRREGLDMTLINDTMDGRVRD